MALNCKEIDTIIAELDLKDSYLQKVKAIDYESFFFTFYKPGNPINVLVDLKTNIRIHKISKKVCFLKESHNLVEFIKAYLINGKIISVEQPDENRIIKIKIIKDGCSYLLLIRLWGGFANILVTDENYKILHLHKKSSKKNELPGSIFSLPQAKNSNKIFKLREHKEKSYNLFIENYYTDIIKQEKLIKEEHIYTTLKKKRVKDLKKQIKVLKGKLNFYKKADEYKRFGELILSNIHLIVSGDRELVVTDYISGKKVSIKLDPTIQPNKNSEKYFKKYKKAISGANITRERIEELTQEIIKIENREIELKSVITNVKKATTQNVGLRYNSKGWDFIVGRNAKENDMLLRHFVKGNDMWFHVRDFPGGYVFIKNKKAKSIPLDILIDAGILALYYSKGKNNGKGDIYYTQVKYLKRVKNGKLGQVIPSMNKNLFVTLDKERLEALKA